MLVYWRDVKYIKKWELRSYQREALSISEQEGMDMALPKLKSPQEG